MRKPSTSRGITSPTPKNRQDGGATKVTTARQKWIASLERKRANIGQGRQDGGDTKREHGDLKVAATLLAAKRWRPFANAQGKLQVAATLLAVALVALPAALAFSQTQQSGVQEAQARVPVLLEQEPQGPVIRSNVNLVLVEATVKNKGGQVMKEMKKEDFLLAEEGTPQKIEHFSRDELPLAVALVVDLSGSLEPFLKPLRYATLTALRTLKKDDQVAFFTFSDEVELVEDLTYDKSKIADHFEGLHAEGSTNINDALFLAAEYLRKEAPAARRVIILVSDNVPSAATVKASDVVTEILEADAVLYGIKVPGRNPAIARAAVKMMGGDMVNVGKAAGETGGEVFDVEKEGSLYTAFQTVIDRLKLRYTLGYYPTNQIQDGRFRKLDVRLSPTWGRSGADYTVLSKRGYYAPRPSRASR